MKDTVVLQVGVNSKSEDELDELTLDELVKELEGVEYEEEEHPNKCRSFFKNIYRSWTDPRVGDRWLCASRNWQVSLTTGFLLP